MRPQQENLCIRLPLSHALTIPVLHQCVSRLNGCAAIRDDGLSLPQNRHHNSVLRQIQFPQIFANSFPGRTWVSSSISSPVGM